MSSSSLELAEAQDMLRRWREAEKACATSQSYTIGSRSLSRANLSEIAKRIEYWENRVAALKRGSDGGRRVIRIVPRDL